MSDLSRIETQVELIAQRLEEKPKDSWFEEQTKRVFDDLGGAPVGWALAGPSLFSAAVAKMLSMLSSDWRPALLSGFFLWLMALYIAIPLVAASLVSFRIRWIECTRILILAALGALAAAFLVLFNQWSAVVAASVVAVGVGYLLLHGLRNGRRATPYSWARPAPPGLTDFNQRADAFRMGASAFGLIALVALFAPEILPKPSSFQVTFGQMKTLSVFDSVSRSITRSNSHERLSLAAATIGGNVAPCTTSRHLELLLTANQAQIDQIRGGSPPVLAWANADALSLSWNKAVSPRVIAPAKNARCFDDAAVRDYLNELYVLDEQLGALHESLFEDEQKQLAAIYTRERLIGLWAFGSTIAILSFMIGFALYKESALSGEVVTAYKKARAYYTLSLAVALLFIIPLLPDINADKINPEHVGDLFTFKNFYFPTAAQVPPPPQHSISQPNLPSVDGVPPGATGEPTVYLDAMSRSLQQKIDASKDEMKAQLQPIQTRVR
jgi:hypothetical protein